LSTFAGLRPLVKPGGRATPRASALVPRDHSILVSPSDLVSVTGGKWTTYRKMAEETIDCALTIGGLPQRPCRTEELPLHGCIEQATGSLAAYGSDPLLGVRAGQATGSLVAYGSDASEIRAL